MNKEDWEELAALFDMQRREMLSPMGEDNLDCLFVKTRTADMHPEDWEDACECQECRSIY